MRDAKTKKARLIPGHGWRAQPNHKILVLGRGAVRLEYPETWIVEINDDCVKVYDKGPPDDDCVLAVSYHHWPVVAGGKLPVASLVRTTLENDERSFISLDPIVEEARMDIALAWAQGRFIDLRLNREACACLCIARRSDVQALVTFDFWLSDLELCDVRWRAFLATLQLGQRVADPRLGPSLS